MNQRSDTVARFSLAGLVAGPNRFGLIGRRPARWEKMHELQNKQVLVVGLGAHGRAACELLHRCGARVVAVDSADTKALQADVESLQALGVRVELGTVLLPRQHFDLAVVSPAVGENAPLFLELAWRNVPLIGELELGYQQAKCLTVAIAGTNGKSTTTGLVERLLTQANRKAAVCGHQARPLCAAVEQSKDLDFLILQVNAFQLEMTRFFRPAVAVLLNLAPDHLDRYRAMDNYVRANARFFTNQRPFDWAIVQSEALDRLQSLALPVPGKIITFSAKSRKADIYLERGLILSQLSDWHGPLLDMDHCQLRGPHNAENVMAALAVGHVLRLPLDVMVAAAKSQAPGPHRCELVAEIGGVKYINDSKATNVDAMSKGLLAMPSGQGGQPNVWLIAGGQEKGLDFHEAGPLLSQRVKGAMVIGEAREKIRAAWSLFTPCTLMNSLLEAVAEAAKQATPGDVVLLSPACSSFDQFRNYQHRGEVFRQAVESICGGGRAGHPN